MALWEEFGAFLKASLVLRNYNWCCSMVILHTSANKLDFGPNFAISRFKTGFGVHRTMGLGLRFPKFGLLEVIA